MRRNPGAVPARVRPRLDRGQQRHEPRGHLLEEGVQARAAHPALKLVQAHVVRGLGRVDQAALLDRQVHPAAGWGGGTGGHQTSHRRRQTPCRKQRVQSGVHGSRVTRARRWRSGAAGAPLLELRGEERPVVLLLGLDPRLEPLGPQPRLPLGNLLGEGGAAGEVARGVADVRGLEGVERGRVSRLRGAGANGTRGQPSNMVKNGGGNRKVARGSAMPGVSRRHGRNNPPSR